MGLGFGLIAEIKKAVAEAVAPLTAQVASLTARVEQVIETQKKHTEWLQFLVAEVSRFKNDSDELMISMYAFHHIYGISFTHDDLGKKGLIATRYSRKHGYRIAQTSDPRFGSVNLYEPEALERCFLGFTDDDYCVKATEVETKEN